jgi:DNA polymerase-3 subunit alpha
MVEDYVSRKHGLTRVEYLVPELEELTAETLGVIVYQDQVLQIANRLAGYSLGEADLLRRAMGKKDPKEMEKQRERFLSGCKEKGIDARKAEEIFRLMAEFAGYGFPKAHSTAYALVTYQTAYLKANHPREFLAALMSADTGNHEKLARYIAHSREHKIEVLPPDVNESARDFTVTQGGIRFGLAGVKNVGEGAIEALLEARAAEGRFRSHFDFCRRVDGRRMNRRVVESLIKCGAFDSLCPNRAALWLGLDAALEAAAAAQRDQEIGQGSLFGAPGSSAIAEPALPDAAAWTDRERLAHEKEVLGFYVTGHPLAPFAPQLSRYADTTATTAAGKEGREVRAGGLITALRETRTRKGQVMAFATLEDLEGSFDLVIFAEPYARLAQLFKRSAAGEGAEGPVPLLVSGDLEGGDTPKILVRDAVGLEEAEEKLAARLEVRVRAEEATRDRLLALRSVLAKYPGDCAVSLHLLIPGSSETVLALAQPQGGVQPSEDLLRDIDALFGRPVSELVL